MFLFIKCSSGLTKVAPTPKSGLACRISTRTDTNYAAIREEITQGSALNAKNEPVTAFPLVIFKVVGKKLMQTKSRPQATAVGGFEWINQIMGLFLSKD